MSSSRTSRRSGGALSNRNEKPGELPIDRLTLESGLASWESPDETELNQYDTYHIHR
jgi:hypothetical protein